MLRAVAIKLVSIDNDIENDQTNNLSLVSTSLPPSLPSQDELEKIKIRGLETEMKKNKAEHSTARSPSWRRHSNLSFHPSKFCSEAEGSVSFNFPQLLSGLVQNGWPPPLLALSGLKWVFPKLSGQKKPWKALKRHIKRPKNAQNRVSLWFWTGESPPFLD